MSWQLVNWFGSKQGLEQAREDIHEFLQKEFYLGVSGIEQPEQSSNRIPSKELFLNLNSLASKSLEEMDIELLQFIHDELPPVVRDEVGIFPFFTNVLNTGFLVMTFVRNATHQDIMLNKLPLALVTSDGKVVARKSFEMLTMGGLQDMSASPCEFLFTWEDFLFMPEDDTQLFMVYDKERLDQYKMEEKLVEKHNGLTDEEEESYIQKVKDLFPIRDGQVELTAIDLVQVPDGGLKVIVAFMNGLDKRVEFTEVPVYIRDEIGRDVARMHFGLHSLYIKPKTQRVWGFYIPASSLEGKDLDLSTCKAYVPDARQDKDVKAQKLELHENNKGFIQ